MAARTFGKKKQQQSPFFFYVIFDVYTHVDNRERVRASDCKQRRRISLQEKHENVIAAVIKWEMLAASKEFGFGGEGKTGVPEEKPLGARERTNNKLNPHMASTPGFEPGPH